MIKNLGHLLLQKRLTMDDQKNIMAEFLRANRKLSETSSKKDDLSRRERSIKRLINLAINLWRLERSISRLDLDPEQSASKRLLRHLNASKADLAEIGFTYEDLDGKRVPSTGDYALKIIEFIQKEPLEHDTVLETIKPSVFYQGKMVSPGEVIVGIPAGTDGSNT
jgi:hypothetical protein